MGYKDSGLPPGLTSDLNAQSLFGISVWNGTGFESKKFTLEQFQEYLDQKHNATITISRGDVVSLNSIPQTFIPGIAGKAIMVIAMWSSAAYAGSSFSGNTVFGVKCVNATTFQFYDEALLESTVSRTLLGKPNIVGPGADTTTQLIQNDDLIVQAAVGDPTGPGFDITVNIIYQYV